VLAVVIAVRVLVRRVKLAIRMLYCFFVQYFTYAMFVRIAQLFVNGSPLPRHRSITAQPIRVGKLSFYEQYDINFRRSIFFARLCQATTGHDVVSPLCDAVVCWIGDGYMTVSGFERHEVTHDCWAQSWYIQFITDADSQADEG
jgi:hypothetical protein